jgi:DNA-binding GntR family transcriptional regulator
LISSTSQKAYEYILDQIYKGKIQMGDPINELSLSEQIGLSRSPIREALKKLEVEGMVDYYPGRGNFAVQLASQDIEEIFDLRTILETAALRRSAGHISRGALSSLKEKIEKLDPEKDSPEKFYKADEKLHGTFVSFCGNRRLENCYRTLMLQIELVRRISARQATHFEKSKQYHLNILEALMNGDVDKAAKILEEHLNEVRDSTTEVIKFSGR